MDEGLKDHAIKDGDRELQFVGQLLGESSSFRPGKTRWAEIKIYVTEGGNYIVSGIGRSINPGEHDKCWAQICSEPEAVIERLHLIDGDGAKYMPYSSRQALEQSRLTDERLSRAYLVTHVD